MFEVRGKIRSVDLGDMDRGNSFFLNFDLEGGTAQGFGGWNLGTPSGGREQSLVREICAVCEIELPAAGAVYNGKGWFQRLVGMELIALYETDPIHSFSSTIRGIKNPRTGVEWLIEEWALRTDVAEKLLGGNQ